MYLDRLPPQDEERLGTLRQKPCEFVNQNVFNLICLLYPDAHADTVDTWLNEDLFVFVSGDVQRIKQKLGRAGGFDFGDIVPLGSLRSEVGDGESSCQGRAHALKVWA